MNRNRLSVWGLTAAVLCAGWQFVPAEEAFQIGVVDMARLYGEFYQTKRAQQRLGDTWAEFEREFKAREEEIGAMEKAAETLRREAVDPKLDDARKLAKRVEAEDKMLEIVKKRNDLGELRLTYKRQYDAQYKRMRDALVAQIREVVGAHAERKGYELVLDASGITQSALPVLIYHAPITDLTNDVLAILNADADSEAGPDADRDANRDAGPDAGRKEDAL
ncbi:MAG: OmpH family outer membrane protein [Kiritimatiellae bacterium]|nr:OmpH family outer membrane protein [Kiritimatiellia bacterium]